MNELLRRAYAGRHRTLTPVDLPHERAVRANAGEAPAGSMSDTLRAAYDRELLRRSDAIGYAPARAAEPYPTPPPGSSGNLTPKAGATVRSL